MDNQRNLLLAVVLCGLLLLGWDAGTRYFYPEPAPAARVEGAAIPNDQVGTGADGGAAPTRTREGGLTDPVAIAEEKKDLVTSLASPSRVRIDAPEIAGSINLVGARIDDITLKTHRQAVDKDSGPVRLFSPQGTPAQQFAQFGWVGEGVAVPDATTLWQADGTVLTQAKPVTLSWDNGQGQLFRIKLSIDAQYMITADQSVSNTGAGPVVVRPFATVNRTSATASADTWNVQSGPIGAFGDSVDFGTDYDDLAETGKVTPEGRTGWIGFTDIYWLSALIPQDGSNPAADFRSLGNNIFRADVIYQPVTVPAGKVFSRSTRLFAGAKESDVLDGYQDAGITKFGFAIDWGWFRWFEKPIFWLLSSLFGLVGNFGLAIILLTVIIRGAMFPIAQKQFKSMASMKAIQPKMKALQERYKDDKQKQQQEIMALYKTEGVNPLAGCLPLLLQIPVFFALYKVLILSIEMRHQPFILWIKDLSAPDPAMILNLFGLLPFTPPAFLGIGVLAVLLGITMWMTFKLNPTAMDPMQQQIFNIMPWILMFVMAPFAAGLLVYWVTSNILTLAQQSYLYSKHPQLRAQANKDKEDAALVATRGGKKKP
ncbi:membrane protein insertase YidC [Altererythrobacter confluentis]|uniref:Membrane protein insertase YidC n=1 Tax=Allopontixanthobacter confluentis TaxID=1849021 RepID=A0A6L7GIW8_9SPHN|nr:membrane protein insertase YidC [Allopontixanthobacter confluentis]MXP15535.1 membrane protein insertase YidC [Allopontixanthobacter confluentis]